MSQVEVPVQDPSRLMCLRFGGRFLKVRLRRGKFGEFFEMPIDGS